MNFSKNFQVSEIYLNKKATQKKIKKNNINEDKNNIKKWNWFFFQIMYYWKHNIDKSAIKVKGKIKTSKKNAKN